MPTTQLTGNQIKDTDITVSDIANGAVTEAKLNLTDLTTANASTSAHGLVPKAVAPAANVLNVVGIANGETAYTNKSIFDATNPANLGTAAPGTSLIAAHRDHVHNTPNGILTWAVITADQSAAVNNGYICNKGTLLTLTLPTTAAVGTIIRVVGMNAGLWKIAQNASQYVKFLDQSSATGVGGYLSSTGTYDAVELVCIVANTGWVVASSVGNITVA